MLACCVRRCCCLAAWLPVMLMNVTVIFVGFRRRNRCFMHERHSSLACLSLCACACDSGLRFPEFVSSKWKSFLPFFLTFRLKSRDSLRIHGRTCAPFLADFASRRTLHAASQSARLLGFRVRKTEEEEHQKRELVVRNSRHMLRGSLAREQPVQAK